MPRLPPESRPKGLRYERGRRRPKGLRYERGRRRPEGLRYEQGRCRPEGLRYEQGRFRPEGLRYEQGRCWADGLCYEPARRVVLIRPRAAISWSGGKDSLAALGACRDRLDVVAALTMFDEGGARSRSHGLRPELIAAQTERLGLRAVIARCGWDNYDDAFREALRGLAGDGVTHVVFGDLVYPEHREWAEQRCAEAGVTAVEPLWGTPTDTLFDAFVASGARALLVTVREPWLDASWLGRPLGAEMKPIFAERGIDPCGERGEYHTAVIDSPMFSHPIAVTRGDIVRRGECFALDLVPGHLRQGFGAQDAAGG